MYGTPISVVGHPSLQSVHWLNMFGLQMTLYANLITSDGREEKKHVFHQGGSRIVCHFSTTGAQNPQFVNLAADFKSKALLLKRASEL